VKNYFIDALLYQEANKVSKEPLPDDDDSGNEADAESEEDMPATLAYETIIEYFNNPQCKNPSGDDDEWVINKNVIFDYPANIKLRESIDNSPLHMPLHKLRMTSTFVECAEGSVFVVPPSKKS